VRGELDWIVMKALDKERTRRYETANGLARDVERYLADEPVEACPPSRTYRLRKFVRRNRAALAACSLLAVALLVALGGIAGGVGWAIRDRTERQAKVSAQLEAILDDVARLEGEEKWSEALMAARRAEPALASEEAVPDVGQRVRRALADLQLVHRLEETRTRSGIPWGVSSFNRAEGELPSRAEKEYSAAFRDAGFDVDALPADDAAARILSRGAVSSAVLPAMDDWVAVRRELNDSSGIARLNAVLRRADPDVWRQRVRDAIGSRNSVAIRDLAKSADVDRQPAATICFLADAVDHARGLSRADRDALRIDLLRRTQSRYPSDFWINHTLGVILIFDVPGGVPEGMGYLRAAVAVRPESAHTLMNLGTGYGALGQPEQAIACYRKAIELEPDSVACHFNLGRALINRHCYPEAVEALQKIVEHDPGSKDALANLIICYIALQQPERAKESEQRLRALVAPEILKALPTTLPDDSRHASDQLLRRAKLYARMGDFSRAKEDLAESLRLHDSQMARVHLACIELYLGDEQTYRALRERYLVGNTSGTQYKLLLAEAGLLRPPSVVQQGNAGKWIEAGSATTQPSSGASTLAATSLAEIRLLLANGMLDYRRGEFQSADEQLTRSVELVNELGPIAQNDQCHEWAVTAEFFIAMCRCRLSQSAEAEDFLTDAQRHLDRQIGPAMYGAEEYGSVDWLIAHIAAREAEAVIHPQPAAATGPTSHP
jgi:tetratricopeptide (TPR) repeat protein